MTIPHHKFTRRMAGAVAFHGSKRRDRSRRKHNGRLRPLPHMGRQRRHERHDMDYMDWLFGTKDGFGVLASRLIADLDHRRARA